jgi:hypothetical protein
MDFQRLFKRKEEGAEPPFVRDNPRESFSEREVRISEGELLDGTAPVCLDWNSVGGTIRVKAEKVLGILEGRTRIKATVLQDLYPGLFVKAPNPGTEFSIPLQAVVMQLQDLFTSLSSDVSVLEDFSTPFGELAREDEAKLKDRHDERPEIGKATAPKLFMLQPGVPADLKRRDESMERERPTLASARESNEENSRGRGINGIDETRRDPEIKAPRAEWAPPFAEKLVSASDAQNQLPASSTISSGARGIMNDHIRREGNEFLQELYLTDEPLDGSKVAQLILLLPRVTGVVIMLSDGAALGGGICGEISEALLSLTPAFVKHLMDFSKGIKGGSVKFVTFSDHACQLSLTMCGDVVILVQHQGKNLLPGLRERLVATADALNMIYSLPSLD